MAGLIGLQRRGSHGSTAKSYAVWAEFSALTVVVTSFDNLRSVSDYCVSSARVSLLAAGG
jgi:hypothetical protein